MPPKHSSESMRELDSSLELELHRSNRGNKTRRERYYEKLEIAKIFPISICTVNFIQEVNLAYVIRAAVCFGAYEVCVIGSYPSRRLMNELSGTLFDYIKVRAFPNPGAFMRHVEREGTKLVSIELPPEGFEASAIQDYKFNKDIKTCLVVGHETQGVPMDILFHSDIVYIPMPGAGFCLNTSQAANVALYEATKQFEE